VIHIDRASTDIEISRSPATGSAMDPSTSASSGMADAISTERLRHMVMEILREHLRDLERRGLL